MIEPPKRSVTRFFIPLIDVLTLLFCVFLVMPLGRPEGEKADVPPATTEELLRERSEDKARIRQLLDDLVKIQEQKGLSLQERVAIRVLEIDGETGELFYHNPERRPIQDEAAAQSLIENDRRALAVSKKELLYIVLFPRDRDSDKPTGAQRERYERWFRDVQVRFDRPGDGPEKR